MKESIAEERVLRLDNLEVKSALGNSMQSDWLRRWAEFYYLCHGHSTILQSVEFAKLFRWLHLIYGVACSRLRDSGKGPIFLGPASNRVGRL